MRTMYCYVASLFVFLSGCGGDANSPQNKGEASRRLALSRNYSQDQLGLTDQQLEYVRLNYNLCFTEGDAWEANVSKLETKGDLFTLALIEDLLNQGDEVTEARRTTLKALAETVRERCQGDVVVAGQVKGMLETAAVVDITCNPLEYRLPRWTIERIAEYADESDVRSTLEEIRDDYNSSIAIPHPIRSIFIDDRVCEYAMEILAKGIHYLPSSKFDQVTRNGAANFRYFNEFESLFPDGEHRIIDSSRYLKSDGWTPVKEWNSRARLYDRYVIHMRVAIDIAPDGTISERELPNLDVLEVQKVLKGKGEPGGPKYELDWSRLPDNLWEELVSYSGDFSKIGLKLVADQPVPRFETYWNDTR